MLYDFELAARRVRLWQRTGESYEHVLMKALGYAMFVAEFPALEIERRVGLRYKPDLVALGAGREFDAPFAFWGECGQTAMRKVNWLLKHAGVARLVLFKIINNPAALVEELRAAVDARYRERERLVVVNFAFDIAQRTRERRISRVPESWYTRIVV
ncbi:MAG TPA: hypothetical protein VK363_09240 [Pyrinomonadaceae bacterium]|nr:hypothetical protein [Pyrinomonadaceae bacterium]